MNVPSRLTVVKTSAAPSSRRAAAVRREDVPGGHRELEEDVEVEEVARQEHARQPGGQQDDEAGERPLAHAVQHLHHGRGKERERRQKREEHPERVGAEGDPDADRPVARRHHDGVVGQHRGGQRDEGAEVHREGRDGDPADHAPSPVEQREQETRGPGDDERQRQGGHRAAASSSACSRSWSRSRRASRSASSPASSPSSRER